MSASNNQRNNKNETVRVCVRVRPLLKHEDSEFWSIDESANTIYTTNFTSIKNELLSDTHLVSNQQYKDIKRVLMDSQYSPQSFAFDRIYSINANSQMIYKESLRDITKSVLNGYNSSIFMYGQTTSGKTFTMLGSPNSPGILPCTLMDVFSLISKDPHPENYTIYCSYIEIYNENIHDLLTDTNYLKLIDDSKYGVIVAGAKRVKINNFEDGIGIKDFGEENRKYRETLFNEYSSRSHTIFQIFIESIELISQTEGNDDFGKSKFSCLNLVDLAGSERIHEYDSKAEGSGETGYINKSLFVLANVINKLAESKKSHIPYRDSKLTRLLSQALGGKSLTAIICTVSPAAINYYQTLSTLRFGTRAKIVKLKPMANEYLDEKSKIEYYKNEIKRLKSQLENKDRLGLIFPDKLSLFPYSNDYSKIEMLANSLPEDQKELINQLVRSNKALMGELLSYKELFANEKEKNEAYQAKIEKLKSKIRMLKSQLNECNNNMITLSNKHTNQGQGNDEEMTGYNYTLKNSKQQYPSNTLDTANFNEEDNSHHNKKRLASNLNKYQRLLLTLNEDDIIGKILNRIIFKPFDLEYNIQSSGNYEDNIRIVEEEHENKLDSIEKLLNYYKSYINTFFRNKIKETSNTNIGTVEFVQDQLPLLEITTKHNEILKLLREQYEAKIQEIESVSPYYQYNPLTIVIFRNSSSEHRSQGNNR